MPDATPWPTGAGAAAELVRRTDFAATSLGPTDRWPSSLRSVVDMLLACSFPMVALCGPDLVQIYNDSCAALMGRKHPSGMGRPTAECWPEVWHINEPIYRQVREGNTLTFENKLLTLERHGYPEDAYFDLCFSPLRDEQHDVSGILVTVVETTQQNLSRVNQDRLRAFVNATTDVVYTMSPDWKEMRSLDGKSFLEDTDDPSVAWWDVYIPKDARPRVLETIDNAIRTKGMFDLEHPVIRREGTVAWTHSRAVPMLNEQGEITEWIGAASDVTPRREAKELRHALAERDTLLAEVHHRVKNNLQVITSMLEMQGRHAGDERSLNALKEASNRVASIAGIHEILYQSRSYAEVDLMAYAHKLVPHLISFYGAQNRIGLTIGGDPATLELERAVPFGLLLNELVSNVCKHAFPKSGTGHLDVHLEQTGQDICLHVKDDGAGFPAESVYRHAPSLGLQIVDVLADQLKGKVAFLPESAGTHVKVSLPRRSDAPRN